MESQKNMEHKSNNTLKSSTVLLGEDPLNSLLK